MEASVGHIFQQNLNRWSQICPQAAEKLAHLTISHVDFSHSANGELNLRRRGEPSFEYHSSENPTKEAQIWFSQLPVKTVQVVYVYGVGLGYYYEAAWDWLRQSPEHSLVFFEDDLEVIHRFLETEKARNLLFDRQVTLYYIGSDDQGYVDFDIFLSLFSLCEYTTTQLNIYQEYRQNKLAELKAKISFFTNINRSQTVEYGNYGLVFLSNFYQNLLELPRSYLADGLFGKFAGMPAIICGAGPSLAKNIDLLATLQDRALIFSGGTGLNALQTKGISPHIAVGIDPNIEQFSRLVMFNSFETPLVYRNRLNNEALDAVHGPKLYNTGSGGYLISEWVEEQLGIKGERLEEGCNVLNFSLSLAHAMQCNPIICVGIDLSYSKGQSYTPGIISHPIHDRKSAFRTKNYHEELLIKDDINGEQVYTLWKWMTEALWYSKFSKNNSDTLLINATEGGIGFPNVLHMPLREVAERYLDKQYDVEGLVHGEIQNSPLPESVKVEKVSQLLVDLSDGLQRCWEICHQLYTLYDEALQNNWQGNELDFKDIYTKAREMEDSLLKEECYAHLLKVFNDAFLRSRGFELQRLVYDEGIVSSTEMSINKMKMDMLRYNFLKQTALMNSAFIRDVLRDHEEKQSKIREFPPAKREVPTEPEHRQVPPKDSHIQRLYYPEGELKAEQFYREAKLHGPSRYYGKDGQLLVDSWFSDGKLEGKKFTRYGNGALNSIQTFKQGLREDVQKYFYPAGNIKSLIPYSKGHLHGEVLLFHPSGILARRLNFENGKRNGIEQFWDERGVLILEAEYAQDQPFGTAKQWHFNGELAKEVIFDQETAKCIVRQWNENGIPIDFERALNEDYFDQVTKQTTKLTETLGEVYSRFTKAAPMIQNSIDDQEKDKLNLKDDLEELQREMEHLRSLSKELNVESGINAENPMEALWKSVSTQRDMEKKLENLNKEMSEELNKLTAGLKEILKAVDQKKNKEHP